MDENRQMKKIYESECSGKRIVGKTGKEVDGQYVCDCMREKDLTEGQEDEIVYDKNAWSDFVWERARGFAFGRA